MNRTQKAKRREARAKMKVACLNPTVPPKADAGFKEDYGMEDEAWHLAENPAVHKVAPPKRLKLNATCLTQVVDKNGRSYMKRVPAPKLKTTGTFLKYSLQESLPSQSKVDGRVNRKNGRFVPFSDGTEAIKAETRDYWRERVNVERSIHQHDVARVLAEHEADTDEAIVYAWIDFVYLTPQHEALKAIRHSERDERIRLKMLRLAGKA